MLCEGLACVLPKHLEHLKCVVDLEMDIITTNTTTCIVDTITAIIV